MALPIAYERPPLPAHKMSCLCRVSALGRKLPLELMLSYSSPNRLVRASNLVRQGEARGWCLYGNRRF